jgi:hypothetical protein
MLKMNEISVIDYLNLVKERKKKDLENSQNIKLVIFKFIIFKPF